MFYLGEKRCKYKVNITSEDNFYSKHKRSMSVSALK